MRVAKLSSEFAITPIYRHFPLHPDTPPAGMTLEELFAGRNIDVAAAQKRMAALMAEEGLPYGERTMTYNSRLAQELGKWADSQANAEAFHETLFRAYFVENVNLATLDNLVQLAEQAGLPASEARRVLEQREYQQAVDADWQRSRELGVTGVPTFVAGGQGLVGAQPYEQLEALVIAAGAKRHSDIA